MICLCGLHRLETDTSTQVELLPSEPPSQTLCERPPLTTCTRSKSHDKSAMKERCRNVQTYSNPSSSLCKAPRKAAHAQKITPTPAVKKIPISTRSRSISPGFHTHTRELELMCTASSVGTSKCSCTHLSKT